MRLNAARAGARTRRLRPAGDHRAHIAAEGSSLNRFTGERAGFSFG
jgi:hypothetical protein